ncbi:MAG TPA: TonB-dependent receptor [Acidobacteriaceae bacterium]|jgi:hypothetical protein|nr:TonB-dependent receptor [Acidobacteriaceae bacterium]
MKAIGQFTGKPRLRECHTSHVRMFGVLALLAMLLGVSSVVAQTITGTIRGTVTDPSGAVVAGATVTATNVATGIATNTVTNHAGLYNIQFLPIGQYTITATATGFSTASVGPFSLQIDQIAKIDAKLQLGNASTTVNVSAENAPMLQTQNATLGTTISGDTMVDLPNNALNFQFNTLFVPGAVLPSISSLASADGNERNSDWYGSPSFNGARGQNNNYVLDGIEINETLNNYAGYNPAPASIQEMRVITGNADAEYGNVSGGEDLMVTKGGTNHYHGGLYEYFQSNIMAANTWSNNFSNLPLTPFTQNQFGATFGGPIKKNKLFFFGDYLGFRYHSGGLGSATVATDKMRTGDFSELLSAQYGSVQLYNNQKGAGYSNATPYTNNKIPINNPVARFLFANPNVYPLPNAAPIPGLGDLDNYQGTFKSQTQNNQGDVRVDYTVDSKDSVMGRYSYGDAFDFEPKALIPAIFPSSSDYPFQSFVGNWVHTFSPALVNEFRVGFSRTVYTQNVPSDPSGVFGLGGNAKVGIPFPNQPYPGFSQVDLSSFESNMGTTALVNLFHENNFYYGDDLTWQHGTHTTKFGVQILRYQQNSFYPGNAGALGSFYYSGNYTANPTVNQNGWGLADWVLDQSTTAQVGGVAGPTGQRQYRTAYYAQDDWRILPNLTLNLGVRYGYDQPIYEVNNKEANIVNSQLVNPNPLAGVEAIRYAGVNGASRALYNPFYWGFMPRIGFAFQANPRMVFRGAYGTTDDLEGTGTNRRLTQNPPFLHQFVTSPTPPTTSSSGGAPLRVENGFNVSSGSLSTDTTDLNAFRANFRPALIQQFNLAWQYLLTDRTSAQLGYVGNVGQHLTEPEQYNQWSSSATGALANNDCIGTATAHPAPFCGLVGNYGTMFVTGTDGFSNYNAMQATLHHQTSNGTEFTINYTWSRAMTDNAGFYGVPGTSDFSSFVQDIHNPRGDYGPTGQDTRNALNATGVFPLPFGQGRRFGANVNRLTDEALGGWMLSGDAVLYSGFPVVMNSGENYYVNSYNAHAIQFQKMRIVHRTTRLWFGTDPSATPCLAFDSAGNTINNGTCAYGQESETGFGNAQNGSERAPGFRQIDLSAFKTFKFTDTQTLQLRGDAFNAFNFASYGPPDNNLVDAAVGRFGLITGTNSSQRIMQVAMHYMF